MRTLAGRSCACPAARRSRARGDRALRRGTAGTRTRRAGSRSRSLRGSRHPGMPFFRKSRLRAERSESLAAEIESKRRELGEIQSHLAVLEERRSAIVREMTALQQQARNCEERSDRAAQQIQQAEEQQTQSRAAIEALGSRPAGTARRTRSPEPADCRNHSQPRRPARRAS